MALFPQAGPAPQAISVLLVASPPNMPPRIQGEVVNIDRSGQVIINTAEGQVIIQTDAKLAVGQKVDIRLPAQTPGAPPIATVIPMPTAPVRAEEIPQTPLPPPVMLEIAEEQTRMAAGLPPQVAPQVSGYTPPSAVPPAQTLFQLVGLDLPATVFDRPQAATPAAALAPEKTALPFSAAQSGSPFASPQSMTLERVHILFIGNLNQAQDAMKQSLLSISQTAAGSMKGEGAQQPMLAQLVGLTPQKLPIFQTIPLGMVELPTLPGNFAVPDNPRAIQSGSQIVLHSPILMTMQEERQAGPVAALLVTLPVKPPTPESMFALDSLPTSAPLLTQLLRDPASVVPAAMGAQIASLVPRPGSPRFAMNMTFALLGLSSGEPSQFFGKALLEALKPEQRAHLQKELQNLPTLGRDAPQGGETRMQIPVEMAGQMTLWQLTIRHHEGDPRSSGGGEIKDTPTRFILDFYMSQLGPLQMDGLAFSQSRRLDLILRTSQPLAAEDREMLRRESTSIFEKTRLAGSLEFQALAPSS